MLQKRSEKVANSDKNLHTFLALYSQCCSQIKYCSPSYCFTRIHTILRHTDVIHTHSSAKLKTVSINVKQCKHNEFIAKKSIDFCQRSKYIRTKKSLLVAIKINIHNKAQKYIIFSNSRLNVMYDLKFQCSLLYCFK